MKPYDINTPARDRIPALKAEVRETRAKLDRIKIALEIRQKALNRLLAAEAMNGSATARTDEKQD